MNKSLRILPALTAALLLGASAAAQDAEAPKAPIKTTQDAGAPPNDWVSDPEIDLGTHLEGEVARGSWSFRNPTGQPQSIKSFQPSCTCSKVVVRIGERSYRIENQPRPHTIYRVEVDKDGHENKEMVESVPVGADEEGAVDVEIDLHNINGRKEASATIHTSDEKNRVLTLKATAFATQFFQVSPPEVNLNKMGWQETRNFSVRIVSPIQKDFEITGHDTLPDHMELSYKKEMNGEQAVWVVDGTYGPGVDPKAGGGIINLRTDVQGKAVQVRVVAWIEGPLNIRPGTFVPLGRIASGTGGEKEIEIEPTDDFDLQVVKIELKNLTVDEKFITVTPRKDGKVLKITIAVAPNAPRRLVRGDVLVYLNHPSLEVQEFQFNGFVR